MPLKILVSKSRWKWEKNRERQREMDSLSYMSMHWEHLKMERIFLI